MDRQSNSALLIVAGIVLSCVAPGLAQQKGQWVPGQSGLNAGILPDPGFTTVDLNISYSATELKDSNGNSVPVKGSYGFWALEQGVYYVPDTKILGGHLAFLALLPAANGSLTAPVFGVSGGGEGYADTYIQPATLGWHLKRADTYVAYAFTAPTGKFSPLGSNNVGSGYWGNNL